MRDPDLRRAFWSASYAPRRRPVSIAPIAISSLKPAAQPINTAGNTGRNTLHGPPQRRIDLSIFKNVALSAAERLQLRAEIFNVTNLPSFAAPNSNFGTAGFGSITSTGNAIPRQMQFAAKLLF